VTQSARETLLPALRRIWSHEQVRDCTVCHPGNLRGRQVVAVPNRAREIKRMTISSARNYRGSIRDLVLDDNGRAAYLLMEHEGKLVLMPWQRFSVETDEPGRSQVRSYYDTGEVPAQDRSTWDTALEKALHEVPQ